VSALSPKLAELVDTFELFSDPTDRADLLISYADAFAEVPAHVATRPFPSSHLVPHCESEAYVWAVPDGTGALKFYFAVENPAGVSAKALAVVLDRTLSGAPLEAVAAVPADVVERIFRQNLSMGKGLGLMSMVQAVTASARRALRGDAPSTT
jgi:cysteine desulfuration protein SufE